MEFDGCGRKAVDNLIEPWMKQGFESKQADPERLLRAVHQPPSAEPSPVARITRSIAPIPR